MEISSENLDIFLNSLKNSSNWFEKRLYSIFSLFSYQNGSIDYFSYFVNSFLKNKINVKRKENNKLIYVKFKKEYKKLRDCKKDNPAFGLNHMVSLYKARKIQKLLTHYKNNKDKNILNEKEIIAIFLTLWKKEYLETLNNEIILSF